MTEHPVEKRLAKMGEHHKHGRKRHHDEATRLAAERDAVEEARREALAGKVGAPDEAGSDHGSG